MRLFHKIFLCFIVIFGISFQTAGYLMINYAYDNAVEQQKKYAFQEFQYNKYILQSVLYSDPNFLKEKEVHITGKENFTVPIALYGADKKCLFTNIETQFYVPDFDDKEDRNISYWITQGSGESSIFVYDCIQQGESTVYLITQTDIRLVVNTQRNMTQFFQKIYLIILCIASPLILLLTSLITHSIKNVSKAAKRIAEGSYSERIDTAGKDEIGELADNFNETDINPPAELGRLADASGDEQSTRIKTPAV